MLVYARFFLFFFVECEGGDVIPTYADLCASFQHAVVTHLCKKIQRGMIYADMRRLIPDENRVLVSKIFEISECNLKNIALLWI